MPETEEETRSSVLDSLKRVIRDGADYLTSALALMQARFTGMALSAVIFVMLIALAVVLGLASFILLTVALGFWLTRVTGHAAWSLVILGGVYALFAGLAGGKAVRWLQKINH